MWKEMVQVACHGLVSLIILRADPLIPPFKNLRTKLHGFWTDVCARERNPAWVVMACKPGKGYFFMKCDFSQKGGKSLKILYNLPVNPDFCPWQRNVDAGVILLDPHTVCFPWVAWCPKDLANLPSGGHYEAVPHSGASGRPCNLDVTLSTKVGVPGMQYCFIIQMLKMTEKAWNHTEFGDSSFPKFVLACFWCRSSNTGAWQRRHFRSPRHWWPKGEHQCAFGFHANG